MDIEITGGRIFYTFPFDIPILGKFQITETLLVSWVVMLLITGLCIWLTHDLKVEKISKRQDSQQVCNRKYGREIQLHDSLCGGFICYKRGIQPDQPDRASKPYGRSFHRSRMGNCGIYHDHGTEDQDQRIWRISEGLYNPDQDYDTV